ASPVRITKEKTCRFTGCLPLSEAAFRPAQPKAAVSRPTIIKRGPWLAVFVMGVSSVRGSWRSVWEETAATSLDGFAVSPGSAAFLPESDSDCSGEAFRPLPSPGQPPRFRRVPFPAADLPAAVSNHWSPLWRDLPS